MFAYNNSTEKATEIINRHLIAELCVAFGFAKIGHRSISCPEGKFLTKSVMNFITSAPSLFVFRFRFTASSGGDWLEGQPAVAQMKARQGPDRPTLQESSRVARKRTCGSSLFGLS